jgi:hypothetical protein
MFSKKAVNLSYPQFFYGVPCGEKYLLHKRKQGRIRTEKNPLGKTNTWIIKIKAEL